MSFLRRFAGNSTAAAGSAAPVVDVPEKREWHNEKEGERYFGMENFGNTCYANSVLQSLYFSQPFRELIEAYQPAPSLFPTATSPPSNTPPLSTTLNRSTATLATPVSRRPDSSGSGSTPGSPKKNASQFGTSAGRATIANVFGQRRPSSSVPSDDSAPATPTVPQLEGGAPLSPQSSFTGVGVPVLNTNGVLSSELPHADTTLLTTLHDLFTTISSQPRTTGTVAPMAFINQLKRDNEFFRSTLHQDAHEFLNYLVNMIAEAVEKEDKLKREAGVDTGMSLEGAKTWVHKLFEGVLTNETRCLTCETVTSRDEAFLDLSIDIEPNSSVTSCLRQFSASEMLCQRNKFSCDQCCGLQEAEKRMKIKKLPNILALHLKRFKYEESLQRHVKLTYRVVFPFELRLFNTADGVSNPDRLYELWAIVVHIGVGPHHGHYITIVRSGARWIVFDDNSVYPIEESDICKFFGDTPGQGSGYVLFYQAVDLDLNGLGLRPHIAPRTPVSDPASVRKDSVPTVQPVRVVSMGEGLGLAMEIPQRNGSGPTVGLPSPAPPNVDTSHTFYPMTSPSPRIHDSPASTRSIPLPTIPADSVAPPILLTAPVTPKSDAIALPPPTGAREPEKEVGRGLRGTISARIGRSLSLGPGKDKEGNRRNSSPNVDNGPSAALQPLTNGHVEVNRSVNSFVPPVNQPDGELPPSHLFDTAWMATPPLTSSSHPAPASDDGSASTHSTGVGAHYTNGTSAPRRESKASIDLFAASGGALSGTRNLFLRKRPIVTNGTPSSVSLPSPDSLRSPIPTNGHSSTTIDVSPLTKKDLERRAKEEKKLRDKELERLEKERQRRIKEDARRVKEEKEEEKKREKLRRKTSIRPV